MSTCDIIIPVWNQLEITKRCISCIEKNTAYPHRLVIIDNASESDTRDFLQGIRNTPGSKITLVRNKENEGFIKAVNKGISLARGKFICLLNNDTIVTPGWLSEMIKIFELDPKMGIVNPSSNSLGQKLPKGVSPEDYSKSLRKQSGQAAALGTALGFCILVKNELFSKVGCFDEIFGRGNFDDTDFSMRAKRGGYGVARAMASYVYHDEQRSFKNVKSYKQDFEKNKKIFESRWGKTKRVIVILKNVNYDSLELLGKILKKHAKEKSWVSVISPFFETERFFRNFSNLSFYHYGGAFYVRAFFKTLFKKKKPDLIYGDSDIFLDILAMTGAHSGAAMKKIGNER